jgi:glycosyltransferase involved in cell wall biosynthesis
MAELAQRGGAPRDRIVVIPNGIDPADIGLDHATAAPARSGSGRLELLFVGRLSVEKGVDLLIRSAAVLQDQGIAFHLRIAGSGLDAESLRLQTTAMKLDERVEFLGTVPRKNLGALYQSADVLCVPSRSEPFGIVVLEAMAAGVAVVATRVGGIPYVVEDGVTGLLCPADDPVALAAALRRCAAERESTRAMGLAGLDRVARQFNWPKIGERLAEVVLTHPQSQPLSA